MTKTSRTLSTLFFALLLGLLSAGCDLVEDGPINDTSAAVSGRPYFEVWKASNGRFYFHLVAGNHETILSSQSYSSRTAALGGVLSVLDNAGLAQRYDLLQAANGEYYFNLKAANGRIIGTSETYSTKSNASQGINGVIANVADYLEFQATRTGARFEVKEGRDGRFFFNLRAANGAVVLTSQGYSSEAAALNGTFSVVDNGFDAASYDVREAASGGYYFNLYSGNGQIIGTSEVYSSKWNAERGRDGIIDLLPEVELL